MPPAAVSRTTPGTYTYMPCGKAVCTHAPGPVAVRFAVTQRNTPSGALPPPLTHRHPTPTRPPQALSTPRTARMSEVARQVVGVALAQRAEALLVGIPVQPGGSLLKPHTDSPMVRGEGRATRPSDELLRIHLEERADGGRASAATSAWLSVRVEKAVARRICADAALPDPAAGRPVSQPGAHTGAGGGGA